MLLFEAAIEGFESQQRRLEPVHLSHVTEPQPCLQTSIGYVAVLYYDLSRALGGGAAHRAVLMGIGNNGIQERLPWDSPVCPKSSSFELPSNPRQFIFQKDVTWANFLSGLVSEAPDVESEPNHQGYPDVSRSNPRKIIHRKGRMRPPHCPKGRLYLPPKPLWILNRQYSVPEKLPQPSVHTAEATAWLQNMEVGKMQDQKIPELAAKPGGDLLRPPTNQFETSASLKVDLQFLGTRSFLPGRPSTLI
jgi:hypothetical protein